MPWEWAEARRELPRGTAEPGPWRSIRAPWCRGVTRAAATPATKEVTFICGSQMGKTDGVLLNLLGHKLDDDPQPVGYIGPTRKNVESISRDRIAPMIRSVPSLLDGLQRGQADKISEKHINGARLGLHWAQSATELATHPMALVLIDERDRMRDVSEGDPVEIARARVATYDGTIVVATTPTAGRVEEVVYPTGLTHWAVASAEDIVSPSWLLWQSSTRHEWAVPCIECGTYFVPRSSLLWYPPDASPEESYDAARLACPHCGSLIDDESAKRDMNARGVFVAPGESVRAGVDEARVTMVEGPELGVRYGEYAEGERPYRHMSFWVSGLMSPWRTYGYRARSYLAALQSGRQGRIRAQVNTGFGELYATQIVVDDWRLATEPLIGDYGIPESIAFIVAGVDVGKRALHWVVRGFGVGWTSWELAHGIIEGDTRFAEPWDELAGLLERDWGGRPIHRMIVDSGYNPTSDPDGRVDESDVVATNAVYEFCRRHRQAQPSKGYARKQRPYDLMRLEVVDVRGRRVAVQGWSFDSDYMKEWLQARFSWPEEESGRWWIRRGADDDYRRQLISEVPEVDNRGRVRWRRIRANHYWDAEVACVLAAHTLRQRVPIDTQSAVSTPVRRGRRMIRTAEA